MSTALYIATAPAERVAHDHARIRQAMASTRSARSRWSVEVRHSTRRDPHPVTVRHLIARLCWLNATVLIVPDNYREHTPLVESLKTCALHMGLQVMPLTRFVRDFCASPLAPGNPASVRATPEPTGAGEAGTA